MRFYHISIIIFFACLSGRAETQGLRTIISGYVFQWDLITDRANVVTLVSGDTVWKGSLMPSLYISTQKEGNQFLKATCINWFPSDSSGVIHVTFGNIANGQIDYNISKGTFKFSILKIHWNGEAQPIIALYFGASRLDPEQRQVVPSLETPFWPDWQSEGFCVPSAKGAPIQSFFRNWQFGHALIPLGSFGESMGTPYAAAFPRPVYSMAMGGDRGWVAIGAGSIPDGAMSLKIKSAAGCLEYLYREDLWGAFPSAEREWNCPLVITAAPEAFDAYGQLFAATGHYKKAETIHQKSHWNTWGDFSKGNLNLGNMVLRAKEFRAEEFTIDMLWETFESSGKVNNERFPHFSSDIQEIRKEGMKIGFWQSVLWVADYRSAGLTKDDLILGSDGEPRLVNWLMSPYIKPQYYALDPSSPNTVKFLQERTKQLIKQFSADLLKLDFGYGLPSPDVGVPRNPSLRGEKYAYTLLKIIADAARDANPSITIQYYSINPLLNDVQDLLALDDMGDAGNFEKEGHGQWAIWSALAAKLGMAIMASSGYNWDNDMDILLNTTIIGSPGLVLPSTYNGKEIPNSLKNKRLALAKWYRPTTGWEPAWFNSCKGSLKSEPTTRCWGRLESFGNEKRLTALALREIGKESQKTSEAGNISFSGNWAIISLNNESIYKSSQLSCIPFGKGSLTIPSETKPKRLLAVYSDKTKKYPNWSFSHGTIYLSVSKEMADSMLGIIIERMK